MTLLGKSNPDVVRCDIFGKKYAQTLRGVTMTCQNRKELELVLEQIEDLLSILFTFEGKYKSAAADARRTINLL